MPQPGRQTRADQGKTTEEEDTMSSTSCAAEASGLADTLGLLNEKRQEKFSKLLAQGERTLSNFNETSRSNFLDNYKAYRNLCENIEEKAGSFRAKMTFIIAQKGGQASENDQQNLRMSRELLMQDGYFPENLESLLERIGDAWEAYKASARVQAQGAPQPPQVQPLPQPQQQEKPKLRMELRPNNLFDINMGLANYRRWKTRATNFAEASVMADWGPEIQRQFFEDLICEDARDKIDLKTCPSFAACMTALEAYWKTEWNKETLLTKYYHG